KYIKSVPDSAGGGQNKTAPGDVGTDPAADYKIQLTTPGTYRLWLRWGGYDGSSDSIYGEIVELRDGPGGKVNDWYRFARTLANNDFALPDGTAPVVPNCRMPAAAKFLRRGIFLRPAPTRSESASVKTAQSSTR